MKSMKRTIAMLLTLALVFASFPLGAFAEQELVAEQSSEAGGVSPTEPQTEVKQEAEEETPLKIGPEEEKEPLQAPGEGDVETRKVQIEIQFTNGLTVQHLPNGHSELNHLPEAEKEALNNFLNNLQNYLSYTYEVDGEWKPWHTDAWEKNESYGRVYYYTSLPKNYRVRIKVDPSALPNTFHLAEFSSFETHEYELQPLSENAQATSVYIQPMKYFIQFNPGGGKFGDSFNSVKTYIDNNYQIKFPEKPTRAGYIFENWYLDAYTKDGKDMFVGGKGKGPGIYQAKEKTIEKGYQLAKAFIKHGDTDNNGNGWVFNHFWARTDYDQNPLWDPGRIFKPDWRRPVLTFYKKDKDQNPGEDDILQSSKVYNGASLGKTAWEDSENQDISQEEKNQIFKEGKLPSMEDIYPGMEIRWVYYNNGVETTFDMDTVIDGDMDVYPVLVRPTLTFYKQEASKIKDLSDEDKKHQILEPVHEVCLNQALEDIDWSADVNKDINTPENKLESLPGLDKVPAGKMFNNRWVYYAANDKNFEHPQEFTMQTKVEGDMELYPLFERPTLTFYNKEKKDLTEANKKDSILKPVHKAYLGASLKDTQWDAEGNEDISNPENKLTELPVLDSSAIPKGMKFKHWAYYTTGTDGKEMLKEFTLETKIEGNMELYPVFEKKDSSDPSNPPTPPNPNPDDPSTPSDPSKPSDPTNPSTPDKPSTDQPSPNVPSKPGTDSGIKTPKGSPLTSSEIAKILAGTKKTVPYIPRAGVGK